jgi:flagellar M-ring protein FliF
MLKQTSGQLEVQHRFEHEMERRVAGMLDRVLGPNRAAVRVTAELKFDQVEENSETYEPVANNEGLPRSTQRNVESYTGTGTLPGGVPGTESNIPGYQAQYAAASNNSYSKSSETVNYEMNKKVAKVVEAPGAVKRLSVAVMVDSLQPQQIESIRPWWRRPVWTWPAATRWRSRTSASTPASGTTPSSPTCRAGAPSCG